MLCCLPGALTHVTFALWWTLLVEKMGSSSSSRLHTYRREGSAQKHRCIAALPLHLAIHANPSSMPTRLVKCVQ